MGRKRKKVLKPWCWYCEREFEEEKVLIHHQKSKHFKCQYCQRKLYTGPGLVIHCSHVHKKTVTEIPNAFPHRNNLEMDIYGTEGIPEKDRLERERNKGAGEDSSKRFKQETGIAFVPAPPGMIPMLQGMPMIPQAPPGPMSLPMMPSQFGMVPPIPPGPMPIPGPSAPPQMNLPAPNNQLHPEGAVRPTEHGPPSLPPPLFPSGPASASERPVPSKQPSNRKNIGYAVDLNENAKLMHPDNEISLEDLRSVLPKYRTQHLPLHPIPFTPQIRGDFQSAPLIYQTPLAPPQEYGSRRHMHVSHPYKQY